MGKRQIIKIDEDLCNGCGLCVPACAEGALEVRDGKVRVVAEILCDGLGACLGECPEGALVVEEREAAEFDEAAVERRLREIGRLPETPAAARGHDDGWMPRLARALARTRSGRRRRGSEPAAGAEDPTAPRRACSNIGPSSWLWSTPWRRSCGGQTCLISADCVPVAYRRFHEDFLTDRRVVVACPKLDDARAHMEKLVDLFQASRPRSVTVVRMEVPCCYGLMALTEQAAEIAGLQVPVEEVVITVSGGRQVAVPAVC